MFGFLMNFVFAIVAEAAQEQLLIIRAIIPDKGVAGDIITINGGAFGDNEKSVSTGYRYVRVGGFINTKVVSWGDSAIKVIAPTLQEATSDITRLNPFWLVADVVSLKFLSFAVKLFDAAVSPPSTEVDNTISITVIVPPFRESNQGLFTYVAQLPLVGVAGDFNHLLAITYDTYGKDIVGLLSDPKELTKTKSREIVRGLQEVPLFVRDLFTGRDPSQSSTTKKDNCDFSHYQIKYNEPQPTLEAIRDKITSLNIGRYSAVNSDGRTVIQIRGNEKDGSLTKTELDKLNKGLAELGIFEPQVFTSLSTINGVCGSQNDIVITKKDMEKLWTGNRQGQESTAPQPNSQTTQLEKSQQGTIVGAVVSGTIVDDEGNSAIMTAYKADIDSVGANTPALSIINIATGEGKTLSKCPFEYATICSVYEDSTSGKIKFNNNVLPGHYILKLTIPGDYYHKGETVLGSKEFSVSAGQEKVDLGNITLSGIKAGY